VAAALVGEAAGSWQQHKDERRQNDRTHGSVSPLLESGLTVVTHFDA
jgi:hypothetical protein